jgi:hypothetical protein
MIKNCYNHLKKNGKLIITDIPAFNIINNKRDIRLGHKKRYGKKEIRLLLESNGFKVIKIKYYGILTFFLNLYLKIKGLNEYPYSILSKRKINFLSFWYKNIENKVNLFGDRLNVVAIR